MMKTKMKGTIDDTCTAFWLLKGIHNLQVFEIQEGDANQLKISGFL
jgi:hypothetical protein